MFESRLSRDRPIRESQRGLLAERLAVKPDDGDVDVGGGHPIDDNRTTVTLGLG
jgi:hypothetical protein